MCDLLDRWSTGERAAVVFGALAICVAISWMYGAIQRVDENADAYQHAIAEHVRWLNGMPESEKKRWPTTSVCRPSVHTCSCEVYGDLVSYAEILPNGDVACHETK